MVFMLSTLSNKNYELYRVIVTVFEKIKVKGIAACFAGFSLSFFVLDSEEC